MEQSFAFRLNTASEHIALISIVKSKNQCKNILILSG